MNGSRKIQKRPHLIDSIMTVTIMERWKVMNNKSKSAVRRFLKSVKKIDYTNSERFAESLGYSVVFFNTVEGDITLVKCGYSEEDKDRKAFTHHKTAKIIFINNSVSSENKLYLLLHEIGHILLNHIGDGKSHTRNNVLMDIETDAFVSEVLNHKKINYRTVICAVVALILGIGMGFVIPVKFYTPATTPESTVMPNSVSDNQNDTVYVTSTGTKFHRAGCRYTKDKDCVAMSRSEAIKEYTPCKICQP